MDIGGLLRDAGEGHGHDHPAHAVLQRVLEGEGHAGQGLAPAGGDGQAKQPRRQLGGGEAGGVDLGPGPVDRGEWDSCLQPPEMVFEPFQQLRRAGHGPRPLRRRLRGEVGLGVEEVGVDQGREQHAQEQLRLPAIEVGNGWRVEAEQLVELGREVLHRPPHLLTSEVGAQPDGGVGPVAQPAVVALDQERERVQPELRRQHRSGRLVVGAVRRAEPALGLQKIGLEGGRGLAQVVEQARGLGQLCAAEGRGERRRQLGGAAQVVDQRVTPAGPVAGVSVEGLHVRAFLATFVSMSASAPEDRPPDPADICGH